MLCQVGYSRSRPLDEEPYRFIVRKRERVRQVVQVGHSQRLHSKFMLSLM
jgi:hypothetical protein